MPRTFTCIGVVGLGTMGAGIAEVFARSGYDVVGLETTAETLERGRHHLRASTDRAVRRGKLDEAEQRAMLERLELSTDLGALARCDLVVEAVVERLEVKTGVIRQVDAAVGPDAVIATNTSSLSVTELATAAARPGRVLGLHFFNPAPVQRLVEVVHTVVTEPEVLEDVSALVRSLGKAPVLCGDRAGFIANTLLFGYLNHAVEMLETRHASREDIDAAMRHGCGYPMGPLALLDLIGLDTAYEILETIHRESRDPRHAPRPLLRQLVVAGLLGRKTGRGFYTYESPGSPVVVPDVPAPEPAAGPRPREVRRVGVVGTGTVATSLLAAFREAGLEVMAVGAEEELAGLAEADLVVEASAEGPEAERSMLRALDRVCKPGAVIATTTGAAPVVSVAAATGRPSDLVGLHLVDGAPGGRLVEVVSTVATDPEAAETARALCGAVGIVAVSCGDRAGFLVDALLHPYLNDAVTMLQEGYATVDDIDTAMTLGCALPRGPFEVLDAVGTDVSLAIQRRLYEETREPGHAPARLLEHLVAAGYLGVRTGRGFRAHSGPSPS